MTREEAKRIIEEYISLDNDVENEYIEAQRVAIKALEQEPKTERFAKWVATEIFDDMWKYNKESFAELACRKLAKLGIVKAIGDEWELIEPQESEDKE